MTDTTTINEANATVYQAEQQALKDAAAAITVFTSAMSAILTGLGTGAPSTAARQFLASLQMTISSSTTMAMASVYGQYGLNPDGSDIVVPASLSGPFVPTA